MDYRVENISGKSFYIPGRVNIGMYIEDNQVTLIDSGGDDSSGRAIYRLLDSMGLQLARIINTHSNADHVGGNSYLQKKTDCQVWASKIEACITSYPILEPLLLWSAFPFKDIDNKFLKAKPSRVDRIIDSSASLDYPHFKVYPLPGHFINMVGLYSPDRVFYIGDSLFSEEIINKYKMVVTLDVGACLETYNFLENFQAEKFVPCHAPVCEDIKELVEINRKAIQETSESIIEICKSPSSREAVLAGMCRKYDLQMNATQYVLNFATVSAHLTYLSEKNYLEYYFEDGYMLWKRAD